MRYLPLTDGDRANMLAEIGVDDGVSAQGVRDHRGALNHIEAV